MKPNIGLSESNSKDIADQLSVLLADTYLLYLKTQYYHWNVTGPLFGSLHLMFETQYQELAQEVDRIAERIRALGFEAPGTYRQYAELTTLKEDEILPSANQMLINLLEDHESICHRARSILASAGECHDEGTLDLISDRVESHEKTAWMLRSSIAE